MRESKGINGLNREIIALLAIIFLVHVTGDLLTTDWLIRNDPSGITNEMNPMGRILYTKGGVTMMAGAKILVFALMVVCVAYVNKNHEGVRGYGDFSETILLGFLAFSTMVLINNVLAMTTIYANLDSATVLDFINGVKPLGLVFAVLSNLLLYKFKAFADRIRRVEFILLTIAVAGPLTINPSMLSFLIKDKELLFIYVLSITFIVGSFTYFMSEMEKQWPYFTRSQD